VTLSRRIIEMLPSERPRERLIERGPEALSEAELLAVLLGSGRYGHSAIAEAEHLLDDAGGLLELARMSVDELLARPGIGAAKAAILAAALELGRRLAQARLNSGVALSNPEYAGKYLAQLLKHERREVVGFLSLDSRHRLIRQRHLITGTRCSAPVDIAALLRQALYDHADGILLYHNHPSGDLVASEDDIDLTERLANACAALLVPLLDHLLIGDGRFISLRKMQPKLFEPAT
jgi:DNA repair protein RadC